MTTYLTPEQDSNLVQWIGALRSGNYKQGRNTFANSRYKPIFFCCMGVAIKEMLPEKFVISPVIPNKDISELFGMYKDNDLDANDLSDGHKLALMNDSEGYEFPEIAQVLEDYLILCRFADHCEANPVALEATIDG